MTSGTRRSEATPSDAAIAREYFGFPQSPHTTAYFTFGRFQPPTRGHRRLFEKMKALAGDTADVFIFSSAKCDVFDLDAPSTTTGITKKRARSSSSVCKAAENPIPFEVKLNLLRKMYPEDSKRIMNIEHTKQHLLDLIQEVKQLHPLRFNLPKKADLSATTVAYALVICGYTDLKFIVGDDRMNSFNYLVKEINDTGNKLELISAGERKEDTTDLIARISGTKVRLAAAACDFAAFAEGIPEPTAIFTRDDQCTMFHALRRGFPSGDRRKKEPCAPVECR